MAHLEAEVQDWKPMGWLLIAGSAVSHLNVTSALLETVTAIRRLSIRCGIFRQEYTYTRPW